jgi:conjugal transfer mating pair stabilization protein TraN
MELKTKLILLYLLMQVLSLDEIVADQRKKGKILAEKPRQSDIKIISGSAAANVDEQVRQIKIGTCEIKKEEETNQPSRYCDFLYGAEGKVFNASVDFDNPTATSLTLQQIMAKDQIIIRLNGNRIYSSTGTDHLVLTNDRIAAGITDEYFDYYHGIQVNGKVVPVQSNKMLQVNPNLNISNYLKKGHNRVDIQVAVGYRGGYAFNLGFNVPGKKETYPCKDGPSYCSQGRERRIINGVYETRDCWQYSYTRTCDYPSKNDCAQYQTCVLIADKECLLTDYAGNCVNILREYSCQSLDETYDIQRPKFETVNPDTNTPGAPVCTGVPCLDGKCGDPEFDKDEDMLPTVSKLTAAGQARGKDINTVSLFAGIALHCSNKLASYSNCCKIKGFGRDNKNGWGHKIGAKCKDDERRLVDARQQGLCVFVGKNRSTTLGLKTVDKSWFCCFGNILDKIIQVQGRQQLGMSFGSAGNPDCRGLNINELMRIDFNKIDYSEFYPVIIDKMKLPKAEDIAARVKSTLPSSSNKKDGSDGLSPNIKGQRHDENWHQ